MRHLVPVAAALVAVAAPAHAQHAINGTWRFDPSTAKLSDKPERFEVRNGSFSCSTCTPTIRVAADGRFHRVPGHPYWDEIKVDASRPDSVAYEYRKGGKLVATSTETVSADGATLSSKSWSINNAAAKPIESASTSTRVEPATTGAHRASGGWRRATQSVATPDVTRLTFQVQGGVVTITEPTGETVTAKLDGPFAKNRGDVGGTEYAYTAPDDRVLVERSRRGGKPMSSGRYTVSPDGRTLTAVYTSARDGGVTTVTATKE
jgi:hypothetical protein